MDTKDMFKDLENVLDRTLQNALLKSRRGVKDVPGSTESDIRLMAIGAEEQFEVLVKVNCVEDFLAEQQVQRAGRRTAKGQGQGKRGQIYKCEAKRPFPSGAGGESERQG